VIFKNHLNCFHRMWTTLFCMMNIKHRINFPTPNYWIVFNYKIFANIEFETVFFSCERDKQSRRGWCFSIILSLFIVRGVLYNKVKLFICYCEKLFFIVFFHCKRVVTSKKNLLFVPIEFKNSLLSRALKVKRVRIFYFSNLSLRQSNEHFHCKRAVTSKKK
jgi:hypothetical protein